MSKRLGINMTGNPKPYTEFGIKSPYLFGTTIKVSQALAKVKGAIVREMMGGFVVDVTEGMNNVFMFTFPTARQWMDLLVKMKDRDKRRKHKWVSDRPVKIGEWLWKDLNSPWLMVKIKVRALVDDTLPPEGAMTEKELKIIYGPK